MNVFGIGTPELLFIAVLALILFGPARLLESVRSAGKTIQEVRRQTQEAQETLVRTFEEPIATAQQLGKEIQQTFKESSGEPESPQGEQLRSPFVFPHRPRREDNDSVGREH